MKGLFSMGSRTDLGLESLLAVICILVNPKKIRSKGTEFIQNLMVLYMLAGGKTINKKGKVLSITKIIKSSKANGKTEV